MHDAHIDVERGMKSIVTTKAISTMAYRGENQCLIFPKKKKMFVCVCASIREEVLRQQH